MRPAGANCADPALVNPGAFEVAGNDVDDDCDGVVDNPLAACDTGLASNASDPMNYARAIDLCQTSVETGPANQLHWGVISAELVLADGTGTAAADSHSIRSGFGANVGPRAGSSMAVLATGRAAASGDTNPDYAAFQIGSDMGCPPTGSPPTPAACPMHPVAPTRPAPKPTTR